MDPDSDNMKRFGGYEKITYICFRKMHNEDIGTKKTPFGLDSKNVIWTPPVQKRLTR